MTGSRCPFTMTEPAHPPADNERSRGHLMMHPDITPQLARDHRIRALHTAEQRRRVVSPRLSWWRHRPTPDATAATVAPRPDGTKPCAPITMPPRAAA
jgi:hypothetical protein